MEYPKALSAWTLFFSYPKTLVRRIIFSAATAVSPTTFSSFLSTRKQNLSQPGILLWEAAFLALSYTKRRRQQLGPSPKHNYCPMQRTRRAYHYRPEEYDRSANSSRLDIQAPEIYRAQVGLFSKHSRMHLARFLKPIENCPNLFVRACVSKHGLVWQASFFLIVRQKNHRRDAFVQRP